MKHRRTPFLLVHWASLLCGLARGSKKAIPPTSQVPTIPEKFVGNTTPGVLFAALEKIVGGG